MYFSYKTCHFQFFRIAYKMIEPPGEIFYGEILLFNFLFFHFVLPDTHPHRTSPLSIHCTVVSLLSQEKFVRIDA